jgi:NAD(P)-dependent dehydrogenase (short-subunit alcohol dehydrogenase family)
VTDSAAVRDVVDRSFTSLGRIDVVVSNAGYGLFGAAEELSGEQVSHIIATNLTGSIQLIRASRSTRQPIRRSRRPAGPRRPAPPAR